MLLGIPRPSTDEWTFKQNAHSRATLLSHMAQGLHRGDAEVIVSLYNLQEDLLTSPGQCFGFWTVLLPWQHSPNSRGA